MSWRQFDLSIAFFPYGKKRINQKSEGPCKMTLANSAAKEPNTNFLLWGKEVKDLKEAKPFTPFTKDAKYVDKKF